MPSAKVSPAFQQQTRGKKKHAKGPHVVNVRLLEDIRGYGRKGSIIPIAPGRMRNIYYPQHKAEYVTEAQLWTTNRKDILAERDFAFGVPQPEVDSQPAEEKITDPQMKLLTPKRAAEIIDHSIPPEIIFYRVPIAAPEPESAPPEPIGKSINAIGGEVPIRNTPEPRSSVTRIFGSVSSADIVESIKAMLAGSEEGARVVLAPEDVSIIEEENETVAIEADRLKALGSYKIEIRLKGVDPIQRLVIIRPQETEI
ncbi:MAG: hypothetical protein L6R40_007849 [Gallowayella cf. fulva]|nr:MAG: hypothetical protein L6R40_007849 [Xanthomendoza cf. fulva]